MSGRMGTGSSPRLPPPPSLRPGRPGPPRTQRELTAGASLEDLGLWARSLKKSVRPGRRGSATECPPRTQAVTAGLPVGAQARSPARSIDASLSSVFLSLPLLVSLNPKHI